MKINYLAALFIATYGIAVNVSAVRPEVPIYNLPTDTVVNQKSPVAANNAKSKPIPITTQGDTSICTQRQISSYYMNTYEYKKTCFSRYFSRQYQ